MTMASGDILPAVSSMPSSDVSGRRMIFSALTESLSARILICCGDSSPETYRSFPVLRERPENAWSRSVDFPMPGSPPTRMTDPATTPLPSTRSNSPMPVDVLFSEIPSMACRDTGSVFDDGCSEEERLPVTAFSSTKLFQLPQSGHLPSHFALVWPHAWH